MKEKIRKELAESLAKATGLQFEDVYIQITQPKQASLGDLAFPCFQFAKINKISPLDAAKSIINNILIPPSITEVTQSGPYLNFKINRNKFYQKLMTIWDFSTTVEKSQMVILEYSSPNIAKPFHVGHLRATLIGNCLDRVWRSLGHKVTSINHLGDWGTQFGFVWAGCEIWGRPETFTVSGLVEIYKRATTLKEEQETNVITEANRNLQNINEMARGYFLDLENGKDYAIKFWKECVELSLEYLKSIYSRLGISFDHYIGESFYSDKLPAVQTSLKNAGLLKESEGALGVDLESLPGNLGFARVYTPDGRSLYLTRDLATAEYRANTFKFDKAIYVVGAPQTLHFQQLKGILRLLGRDYADKITHVPFGHVLGMKTRGTGGFIELNDFLDEAYERSLTAYRTQVEKRPEGLDESLVATRVALAAIIFSTLNRSSIKDVTFNWDTALEFQGDTGPYLLYAFARINGIRERAGLNLTDVKFNESLLVEDSAWDLAMKISDFQEIVSKTAQENEPVLLSNYALELARLFSKAYTDLKVIGEVVELASVRLKLFEITQKTLGQCLNLLGIETLERM